MNTKQDKIAVLILCHKNPWQIRRLLSAVNHPQIDCYLHLDKKMQISEEQIKLLKQQGCEICSKRISCYLADWSLCEAELLLLTEAKKIGYRYYILLSGQDYPIKPVRDFVSLLYKTYPKPYVHTIRQSDGNWIKEMFNHTMTLCYTREIVRRVYRIASSVGITKIRGMNRLMGIIDSVSNYISPSIFEELRRHDVEVYGGSAWWALPDIAVDELLNDIDAHPNIIKWMRGSLTPEESFFQTMIMRTSVANLVDVNRDPVQGEMTYANFVSPRNKVKKYHPYILTEDDWYWLKERPEYFARKFDVDISTKILDILDLHIQ